MDGAALRRINPLATARITRTREQRAAGLPSSQLHFDGQIDHAAVLAALGVPNAEDASHYAAMIRSGATAGSFSVGVPVRF